MATAAPWQELTDGYSGVLYQLERGNVSVHGQCRLDDHLYASHPHEHLPCNSHNSRCLCLL